MMKGDTVRVFYSMFDANSEDMGNGIVALTGYFDIWVIMVESGKIVSSVTHEMKLAPTRMVLVEKLMPSAKKHLDPNLYPDL